MRLHFLIPGDVTQLSGGYIYNRKIIDGLTAKGHKIYVHNPGNNFPFIDEGTKIKMDAIFGSLEKGEILIVDSLAVGPAAEFIEYYAGFLKIIGLIHLPLCMNPVFSDQQKDAFRLQEIKAFRLLDRVITVSDHTRKLIQNFGVAHERIQVIKPKAESKERKKTYPILPRKLLCISNYTRNKGHLKLIRALANLDSFNWELHCYGNQNLDVEYFYQLVNEVRLLGLQKKIKLLGPVPHENVNKLYLEADLFILPSEYESYPMVLAESLVHGLPVVAAYSGGIPEVVPSGAGVFFQPSGVESLHAVLYKAISTPDLYEHLCSKASVSRQYFSPWSKAVDDFEKFIMESQIP